MTGRTRTVTKIKTTHTNDLYYDVVAVNAVPTLNSSSTPMSVSNTFNGSAAQILAPYAAAAAAGFPNDVLGMMPYFYPGLAAAGFYPGTGIPFMQPPGLLQGMCSVISYLT